MTAVDEVVAARVTRSLVDQRAIGDIGDPTSEMRSRADDTPLGQSDQLGAEVGRRLLVDQEPTVVTQTVAVVRHKQVGVLEHVGCGIVEVLDECHLSTSEDAKRHEVDGATERPIRQCILRDGVIDDDRNLLTVDQEVLAAAHDEVGAHVVPHALCVQVVDEVGRASRHRRVSICGIGRRPDLRKLVEQAEPHHQYQLQRRKVHLAGVLLEVAVDVADKPNQLATLNCCAGGDVHRAE